MESKATVRLVIHRHLSLNEQVSVVDKVSKQEVRTQDSVHRLVGFCDNPCLRTTSFTVFVILKLRESEFLLK